MKENKKEEEKGSRTRLSPDPQLQLTDLTPTLDTVSFSVPSYKRRDQDLRVVESGTESGREEEESKGKTFNIRHCNSR